MNDRKPVVWVGSSRKDSIALPKEIQQKIGYSLNLAQQKKDDQDRRPLKGFGGGTVCEIRKSNEDGTFRAVYTVEFNEAVYVLHGFQKKSKAGIKTPQQEIDLIKQRLKEAASFHRKQRIGS